MCQAVELVLLKVVSPAALFNSEVPTIGMLALVIATLKRLVIGYRSRPWRRSYTGFPPPPIAGNQIYRGLLVMALAEDVFKRTPDRFLVFDSAGTACGFRPTYAISLNPTSVRRRAF
jgi:hypothetical protein